VLPLWADVLVLLALPVIVLAAVWLFAEGDDPGTGMVCHSAEDDEPPDTDEGADDVLLAA